MIQLNVASVVHAAKLFGREMVQRGYGKILITASLAAIGPSAKLGVYSATKAFAHTIAEAIGEELSDTGVAVTALMPDATETHFFERAGAGESQIGQGKKADPAVVAAAGYQAMLKGSDHVVAPGKSKIVAAVAKVLRSGSWRITRARTERIRSRQCRFNFGAGTNARSSRPVTSSPTRPLPRITGAASTISSCSPAWASRPCATPCCGSEWRRTTPISATSAGATSGCAGSASSACGRSSA